MKLMKLNLDKRKKLVLDKESIVKLQESQLANIRAGSAPAVVSCPDATCAKSCNTYTCMTREA